MASLSLDAAKAAKWAEIKSQRLSRLIAPLQTAHGVFDCKPAQQQDIKDAVLLAQTLVAMGQSPTITFTLADNSVVELTGSQMVGVGLALGARVQTIHATSRALRAAINLAESVPDLDLIQWT
jgi:hypothetical protein